MTSNRRYLCGTPTPQCGGAKTVVANFMGKYQKSHGSPQQAFKCYRAWLLSQGFEQVDSRAFRAPEDNILGVTGVLLLSKPSHFGAPLRGGKRAGPTECKSKRFNNVRQGGLTI